MTRRYFPFLLVLGLIFIPTVFSQNPQDETARPVAGGGVTVSGWTGKVDAREASQGMTVDNAKFAKEGDRRRLHRERAFPRTEIHESQHAPASVRHRDWRKRFRN